MFSLEDHLDSEDRSGRGRAIRTAGTVGVRGQTKNNRGSSAEGPSVEERNRRLEKEQLVRGDGRQIVTEVPGQVRETAYSSISLG